MGRIPAYKQLYISIKNDIKNEHYRPGNFLPTEPELEKKYNVSRTTVRNAIGMLVDEGYLKVTQGRGTEVQDVSASQKLNKITSLTETLTRRGFKVTTRGFALEKADPPEFIQKAFRINEKEPVYHLQRVQCADEKPICLIENYLLASAFPDLAINDDDCISLYEQLEKRYAVSFVDAIEKITAVAASFNQAQILQIPLGTPLLHSVRVTQTSQKACEYASIYVVADRYEYQIYLKGRK